MRKAKLFMDTLVDIQVVMDEVNTKNEAEIAIDRAFEAFRQVEQACSRFSPDSELMQLSLMLETPVQVSPYLFEPVKFALEMAKWTEGVFDPTIGKVMEQYGFNRHYLTKEVMDSPSATNVSYRDISINEQAKTILLKKPLVIDLGAVAKGFAIDLAANELKGFKGFLVNAGGDIFAGGRDENGEKWPIGIRHPKQKEQIINKINLSNEAICTSGSYERKSTRVNGVHHLINSKTKQSVNDWVNCSIIAPFAMMADAFSTVAFLMGSEKAILLMNKVGVKGILVTPELKVTRVGGL